MKPTPLQTAIDGLLRARGSDQKLDEIVADLRRRGFSWSRIRAHILNLTGGHAPRVQTLINWYPHLSEPREPAA